MSKKIKDVSDSKMINENLQSVVKCPNCNGNGEPCNLCNGVGKVSKQKIKNFKK